MGSKFNFACNFNKSCKTQFDIDLENIINRDKIICPSCQNPVPDDLLNTIKAAATALMKINDYNKGKHSDIDAFIEPPQWKITIKD